MALLGAAALLLAATPVDAVRVGACEEERVTGARISATRTSRGLLCLINAERTARGLRPLRVAPLLQRAARRHARDLVRRRYFAHVSPEGLHARDRIRRTGYLEAATAWRIGEVIGYSDAEPHAARRLHQRFMRSPRHRRLLLVGRFDGVGIGVERGWPIAGKQTPGFTAVVDLGYTARRR